MKTSVITICGIIQVIFITAFAVAANITKPNTFTNGTTADASQVNANFDTAYGQINKNTANISTLATSVANAITNFSTRTVSSGYPYYASTPYTSNTSTTTCGTGEIITGGTCTCNHTSFSSATTNWGVLVFCSISGNSVLGACFSDNSVATYKFGPPITTYAVCASTNKTGSISLAKPVDVLGNEQYQPELDAAIEKMKREIGEYTRMRQGNNPP